MVELSRSLWVALVAGVLLVVVVGVDASMTRDVELSVETEEGWSVIATGMSEISRAPEPVLELNRTDDVRFRLHVDNGYAWSYEAEFTAHTHGQQIASGTLDSEARSTGEAFFEESAETFLEERGPSVPGQAYASVEVDVDGTWLWGSFVIQEVPS